MGKTGSYARGDDGRPSAALGRPGPLLRAILLSLGLLLPLVAVEGGFPLPRLGPWPVVVYRDEERHLAVELPVVLGGTTAALQWRNGPLVSVVLPTEGPRRRSALLAWRPAEGGGTLSATTAWGAVALGVRVVEAEGPWPIAGLRDGLPVDAAGVPVVLLSDRMDGGGERRWAWLRTRPEPGPGPALVAAPPAWLPVLAGLPGATVALEHPVLPLNDLLVAVAACDAAPAAIVVAPGDAALRMGSADAEEPRVLEAVARRWAGQARRPHGVLVLPALPLEPALSEAAAARRQRFRRFANDWGWTLIDEERLAPAASARRLGNEVYAARPLEPAAGRLRAAIASALAR